MDILPSPFFGKENLLKIVDLKGPTSQNINFLKALCKNYT